MDQYRDIIDAQRNYAHVSRCMKKICKACNTEYINFSIREESHRPRHISLTSTAAKQHTIHP
ncbi:hypothetical protein Ethha_2151 [Ethanoligenens harbinense YUAN-3]|uniref:Uncharacterized protein n=1 Tax=Ethanoligenens harbinense (strain DSM 18485 / JCM 12961 / CGMCC 1.5033 / YUAN-3) TaxID=663278 RepID=E6U3Y8_ETHHY|nr:hypothetical protein Ethha_2151 [Ethanoligenens harbinense YUAN-3]AVQ96704.1 hypothetical protein CXQ68_11020 [Ethanoligenens harbinense YUAN-3]AYF39364.1 hypothetical protein CXP51_10910 [Ethanoligenens harbinense]QCN92944.1 hypothetical protein DRA42_11050 [Ethanoligenens harbinense]